MIETFTSAITDEYINFIKETNRDEGAELLGKMRDEFERFFKCIGREIDTKQYGACKQKIETVINKLHAESLQWINDKKKHPGRNDQLTYSDGSVYEGQLRQGMPHGQGKFTKENGDVYEGQFDQGFCHGQGKFTWVKGDVYEGQFVQSFFHGQGKFTKKKGDVYEGQFDRDSYHGQGELTKANGNIYIGQFDRGFYHGQGTLTLANRDVYEGQFDRDLYQGQGTFTWANGNVYQGQFDQGFCRGQGKLTLKNGDVYEGQIDRNFYQGQGKLTYADGDSYEGQFHQSFRHGQGKLTKANGDVYEGRFDRDSCQGQGQMTFANGAVYEGQFHQNCFHGQGRLTYADGNIYEGQFDRGLCHGQGKITRAKGAVYEARFDKNYCQTDSSYLSEINFLRLLIGTHKSGISPEYPLGIISDYLIKNNHPLLGAALKSANAFFQIEEDDCPDLAKKICRHLKNGQPQLLHYGYINHSMGLNLVPDLQSDCVFLEIFNSGNGLYRHQKKGSKYQTMMRRKASASSLTPEKITRFLNSKKFKDEKEAYEEIFGIKGIEKVEEQLPVWQTEQKIGNCSLEWIFAYLKNKMGENEYDKMRVQLFKDCIASIEAIPENKNNQEMQDILDILNKKIEKREKKIDIRRLPPPFKSKISRNHSKKRRALSL